jgi:hypothetical protein
MNQKNEIHNSNCKCHGYETYVKPLKKNLFEKSTHQLNTLNYADNKYIIMGTCVPSNEHMEPEASF